MYLNAVLGALEGVARLPLRRPLTTRLVRVVSLELLGAVLDLNFTGLDAVLEQVACL